MKIPRTPPDKEKILSALIRDNPKKALEILVERELTDEKGRYLHWDKLRHLPAPEGLTSEEWWAVIKLSREKNYKNLGHLLLDKKQKPFVFVLPDEVHRDLHWLTQNASGNSLAKEPLIHPHLKKSYLIRGLVNEAINSSQLEGAATTTKKAKEMLREGESPKNHGEQMIYNNYLAMQFIKEQIENQLTPSIVLELHKILTEKTLNNSEDAARLRTEEDNVQVIDTLDNTVLHVPPSAKELPERLERLCKFANESDPSSFIPPLVKAIILHFMLSYDHPFVDGNGRTARALFYWLVAKEGYEFIEFISISEVLKEEPGQYKRAFLFTETDDNDLTYFIVHELSVIMKCIHNLFEFLNRENEEIQEAQEQLAGKKRLKKLLNYRQLALIKHAIKKPGTFYTIYGHQNIHGITYETARSDLQALSDKFQLLDKSKSGKTWIFQAPHNLRERMKQGEKG